MHAAIEMFTGHAVNAEDIQPSINHPMNAINLQGDAHRSMDQNLSWGIEARSESANNEVRVIRICGADPDMTLIVEILFPCC